jgi:hypothetical protein
MKKSVKTQEKPSSYCERCGVPDAIQFGDHWVCEECYGVRGSCCQEFGADDFWEEKESNEDEKKK